MRNIRKNSWCWQGKDFTHLVNSHYKDPRERCSIRSLYQVLTEKASDCGCDKFKEFMVIIADNAGVSRQTASRLLKSLSALGVVKYRVREKDRNRYGKTEFELFDLLDDDISVSKKRGKSKSGKSLSPDVQAKVDSKKTVALEGYILNKVISLSEIEKRLLNESLKKTLSSEEINNILAGLDNLSSNDLKKLSSILNKNQLGNVIFECYLTVGKIDLVEPVEKDRSRYYKQYVKSIQNIVEYLVTPDGVLNVKDIVDKMIAWANTGLNWNLHTVYKHIEKTPENILKMCSISPKKEIIKPNFYISDRNIKPDINFYDD